MTIRTVAVVAPGDMGHAVAAVLVGAGLRVITQLGGRSPDSVARAKRVGMVALPGLDDVVREADVFLSILPPSRAVELADSVAASLSRTGAGLLYADCNAVAPGTVRRIGAILTGAGGRFVDAGIIGGPPTPGTYSPKFYASGADAEDFAELSRYGLAIRVIGREVGQASALKMCYATMTKGVTALATEALTAAKLLGIEAALASELAASLPALLDSAKRSVPSMPSKAYRWIGEMEEIAATFAAVGLPPSMLRGAADVYRFVGETALAREKPGTMEEAVAYLARSVRATA
jgi:3-hydroxyisobutyrate dehydrogenase-like beta-hydroxyacid dehydrogenase